MKRYSILTFIIGNYEKIHEVVHCDPDAEYVLVTDNHELKSQTWNIIVDDNLKNIRSPIEKCYSIRYNPFSYCSTDICLRIDGSVKILQSTKCIIDKFESEQYDIALMPHPVRCKMKDEYDIWVRARNYSRQQADRCMKSMSDAGYDINKLGFFQAGFAIQRKNDIAFQMNEMTLAWLKALSTNHEIERLDQTIFSCVVNMKFSNLKVMPVSEQLFHSDIMKICYHNTETENPGPCYRQNVPDIKWVFNTQTKCIKF